MIITILFFLNYFLSRCTFNGSSLVEYSNRIHHTHMRVIKFIYDDGNFKTLECGSAGVILRILRGRTYIHKIGIRYINFVFSVQYI